MGLQELLSKGKAVTYIDENREAFNAYMDMQGINWARMNGHHEDAVSSAFKRHYIGSAGLVYEDGHDIEHNGPDRELAIAVGIDWDGLSGEEISWAWGELESTGHIESWAYAGEVHFFAHPWFADELVL